MTRHCARCGTTLRPDEGVLVAAADTGSGAHVQATYAHSACLDDDPTPPRPVYVPSPPPAGFRW